MIKSREELTLENKHLQSIIEQKNKHELTLKQDMTWLHLLSRVTSIANLSEDVYSALRECIEVISTSSFWALGHVYEVVYTPEPKLASTKLWYSLSLCGFEQFKQNSQNTVLKSDEGLVGRVFNRKKLEWIEKIENASIPFEFKRREPALSDGLLSVVAVPVAVGSEITHVMEFYSTQARKKDFKLCQILEQIGIQIGRAVERARALNRLREKQLNLISKSQLAAIGEMTAGIAHEINNPLSVIYARAILLKDRLKTKDGLEPECIQWIDQISATAKKITTIIDGLRSSTRQKNDDPFIKISLKTVIEDTINLCQSSFQQLGATLILSLPPNSLICECRPVQISQVLINLLHNSRDAIALLDQKWVRISVYDALDRIQIRVQDSGKGIPIDQVDKIFQPFFTTKEIGKGTGLGLSISKQIVESHKGSLEYEFDGSHTCFFVELPRLQSDERSREYEL